MAIMVVVNILLGDMNEISFGLPWIVGCYVFVCQKIARLKIQ